MSDDEFGIHDKEALGAETWNTLDWASHGRRIRSYDETLNFRGTTFSSFFFSWLSWWIRRYMRVNSGSTSAQNAGSLHFSVFLFDH